MSRSLTYWISRSTDSALSLNSRFRASSPWHSPSRASPSARFLWRYLRAADLFWSLFFCLWNPPGCGRIRVGGEMRGQRWRQGWEQGHQPCIPLLLPGIAASASRGSPRPAGGRARLKVKRQKGIAGGGGSGGRGSGRNGTPWKQSSTRSSSFSRKVVAATSG